MGGIKMENKTEEVKVEEIKNEETGKVETQATEKKDEGKVEVEMISKEEAQKMVDGALKKKLPPKEEMDAFKQWKESQKTEADKQAEKDRTNQEKDTKLTELQKENTVLKKGVANDELDYVVFKVSKMEGEFDDNLDKFLKDNPKYLSKEESKVVQTTGVKTNNSIAKEGGVMAILKQKHPDLYE